MIGTYESLILMDCSKSGLNNAKHNNSLKQKYSFLLISPNENDIVFSDAVLIMVSLYNIIDIDINSVHLYLDGKDITSDALIFQDIVTYAPQHVRPGLKMFTIALSTSIRTHSLFSIPSIDGV